MKWRHTVPLVSAALVATAAAKAPESVSAFENGNDMVELGCGRDSPPPFCAGYVAGVTDLISVFQANGMIRKGYCPPDHFTVGQAAAVASKYLKDHPELRHGVAAGLIAGALSDSFPCGKEGGEK